MVDGIQFALDIFESEQLDTSELAFASRALLAARNTPVSALAITGAALEFLQMYDLRMILKGPKKK